MDTPPENSSLTALEFCTRTNLPDVCRDFGTLMLINGGPEKWSNEYRKTWLKNEDVCTWAGFTCIAGLKDPVIGVQLRGDTNMGGPPVLLPIVTIPVGTFSHVPNLGVVVIEYTQLKTFPVGIFDSVPNLDALDIELNDLESSEENPLPENLFRNLGKVTDFILAGNRKISWLPPKFFTGLTALKHLDLVGNNLTSTLQHPLPSTLFNEVPQLAELLLFANNLAWIPESWFSKQTLLATLNLSANPIESCAPATFASLGSLLDLELSDNPILTTLPNGIFSSLTMLTQLNLGGNPNLMWTIPNDLKTRVMNRSLSIFTVGSPGIK